MRLPPPAEGDSPDVTDRAISPGVPPVVPVPILAPVVVPPIVLPPAPTLATVPPPLPPPQNVWHAATQLVIGDNGRLQQSTQSAEIRKCISKAVRLAHSNIFFTDAFPSLEVQNRWLSQSLTTVLQDQAQTDLVVRDINLRAQQDNRYMSALISMVRRRSPVLLSGRFLNPTR